MKDWKVKWDSFGRKSKHLAPFNLTVHVKGKINKKGKVQQKVLLYLGTAEKVYNKLKLKE